MVLTRFNPALISPFGILLLNAYTFAQILHSGVFSSKSWVKKFHIVDFTILCFLSGCGCSFDRTAQVLHALKFSNVCECFTGPRVIPRVSAVFRGLRVSEGLQRVGGGMGTGVPRSVPASSVPAFRGLTRTRRSTGPLLNITWTFRFFSCFFSLFETRGM